MASVPMIDMLAALSLASDLANGQPLETAIRVCLLATRLARETGASPQEVSTVFCASLLRFIGCTSFAAEEAEIFGDDVSARRELLAGDLWAPIDSVRRSLRVRAGALRPKRSTVRVLLEYRSTRAKWVSSVCDAGATLGRMLGLEPAALRVLRELYERWDGSGLPTGLAEEDISLGARVLQVAQVAEASYRYGGRSLALAELEHRRGRQLDPALVKRLREGWESAEALLRRTSVWDEAIQEGPLTPGADPQAAALAFARFVDLQTPYALAHSEAVSKLAAGAGLAAGLSGAETDKLATAGLLHDVGQVAIPTAIWLKPGALGAMERERVQMHPYQTEVILRRSGAWGDLATLAGAHHERLDGSGYPFRHKGPGHGVAAQILAAAEMHQAMVEARPYRPALSLEEAGNELLAAAREQRLSEQAVSAVLDAAGLKRPRPRTRPLPLGLTEREAQVLSWVARGKSNKEIGLILGISARTVQQHVIHIYEKTGVSSRAGAALIAAEHALVEL